MEYNIKLKESYGGGYAPFSIAKKFMFENEPRVFTEGQQIMLLESYLFTPVEDHGLGIDVPKLLSEKVVTKYYSLHNPKTVKTLLETWCSWKKAFSRQPVDDIKNYFGEEIGIYFVWIGE